MVIDGRSNLGQFSIFGMKNHRNILSRLKQFWYTKLLNCMNLPTWKISSVLKSLVNKSMVLRFARHHQIENNVAFFLFLMQQCTCPSKNIASALCTIRTIKVVKQIRSSSLNKLTKGKLALRIYNKQIHRNLIKYIYKLKDANFVS